MLIRMEKSKLEQIESFQWTRRGLGSLTIRLKDGTYLRTEDGNFGIAVGFSQEAVIFMVSFLTTLLDTRFVFEEKDSGFTCLWKRMYTPNEPKEGVVRPQ